MTQFELTHDQQAIYDAIMDAQSHALEAGTHPFVDARGYPGTGKTVTMTQALMNYPHKKKLAAAPTNAALSVIKSKIPEIIPEGKVVYKTIAQLTSRPAEYLDILGMEFILNEEGVANLHKFMLEVMGGINNVWDNLVIEHRRPVKRFYHGEMVIEDEIKYIVDSRRMHAMFKQKFKNVKAGDFYPKAMHILIEPEELVQEISDFGIMLWDEMSMVPQSTVDLLIEAYDLAKHSGVKMPTVVFGGDRGQLPPINEPINEFMTQPVDNKTVFELTEILRSTDVIAHLSKHVRQGNPLRGLSKLYPEIIHLTEGSLEDVIEAHAEELAKSDIALTFRVKNVKILNDSIRRLKGFSGKTVQQNEILMATANCGRSKKGVIFANGQELRVEKVYTPEEAVSVLRTHPKYDDAGIASDRVEELRTLAIVAAETEQFTLVDVKNSLGEVITAWIEPTLNYTNREIDFQIAAQNLTALSELSYMFAPVLTADFGYARTIHKSQGSEWQNVVLIMSDRDVYKRPPNLAHTGVSRAKENLTLLYIKSW